MAPPTQKDRPIAFFLEDNGKTVAEVTLGIRPEDLTRNDTSRATVHHTLGGAWIDNFGPGLPTISITGHTGWRGGEDGDGEGRWRSLRDAVFQDWHSRRRAAIAAGRDPSTVKLIFADSLHNYVVEVVPISINLRRSRSRPLLIQYSIALVAVDENENQLRFLQGGRKSDAEQDATGGFFESVMSSIGAIRAAIGRVTSWVRRNLVAPIRNFLAKANAIFNGIIGITRDIKNLVSTVLSIPMMVAQAGVNLMRTIAAVASLPAQIKAQVMEAAGAFSNIMCYLLRSRRARRAYGDYNEFYGASNCSSISGGRSVSSLAGTNSLAVLPASTTTVEGLTVSPEGQSGLRALANSDPVLRPLNDNELSTHLAAVDTGVTVTDTVAVAA